MAKEVREDDVVLLFFSGHGRVPPGQEMFYYIPFLRATEDTGSLVDPPDERETGVSTAMLAEAIRNLPARKHSAPETLSRNLNYGHVAAD
jgi:hypothetical protein